MRPGYQRSIQVKMRGLSARKMQIQHHSKSESFYIPALFADIANFFKKAAKHKFVLPSAIVNITAILYSR